MRTRELVLKISKQSGVSAMTVDSVLKGFIDTMKDEASKEKKIIINNFGVFKTITRKGFTGYNPRNKQTYVSKDSKYLTFKSSKDFIARLDT